MTEENERMTHFFARPQDDLKKNTEQKTAKENHRNLGNTINSVQFVNNVNESTNNLSFTYRIEVIEIFMFPFRQWAATAQYHSPLKFVRQPAFKGL